MTNHYFELRKARSGSLTYDMMRHLHTRQHLGKAVILCDQPVSLLSASRKQWLKLSRSVQKKRAATVSADKILKYTHAVTHMQHMRFTSKAPLAAPEADVYFLAAGAVGYLPARCFTVYIANSLPEDQIAQLLAQLPNESLLVDYEHAHDWTTLGLKPRDLLQDRVTREWEEVQQFLSTYHIDIQQLCEGELQSIDAMEEALDILLGASQKFLQIALSFQHALELARPLRLTKGLRRKYDAVSLLAHRVQALSPGAFTQSFLETYNEDDTFFLYDPSREHAFGESLTEAIVRHLRAGRLNLAKALRDYAPAFKP